MALAPPGLILGPGSFGPPGPFAPWVLPIVYCLLPITYGLLPNCYCLLPTTPCQLPNKKILTLPITCCLLPIAGHVQSNERQDHCGGGEAVERRGNERQSFVCIYNAIVWTCCGFVGICIEFVMELLWNCTNLHLNR